MITNVDRDEPRELPSPRGAFPLTLPNPPCRRQVETRRIHHFSLGWGLAPRRKPFVPAGRRTRVLRDGVPGVRSVLAEAGCYTCRLLSVRVPALVQPR